MHFLDTRVILPSERFKKKALEVLEMRCQGAHMSIQYADNYNMNYLDAISSSSGSYDRVKFKK